jgi:fucose 4-O-acetylase-like acetyltransferase
MEKTNRTRLDYLDYTRALGILLIVMQHAFQYFQVFNAAVSYIKTFHVTIFFVISGYIAGVRHEENFSFRELVIGRAKSLLIPYIVFSCINTFLKFTVLGMQGYLTKEIIRQEAPEFFITGNGTVWFLTTLFLVEVLFYCLRGKYENIIYIISGIILGSIPFLVAQNSDPLGIVSKRTMIGYAFYAGGYFLGRYIIPKLRVGYAAAIILLGTGFAGWKYFDCEMNYFGGEFRGLGPAVLINVCSISGILILMYLLDGKLDRRLKVLRYFGRNSLIVMVMHPIFLMCYIYPFGGRIAGYSENMQWAAGIILYLALIVLEIPAIELIQRYFPFMIGKKKTKEYD